jgi:kinesin family protein C2/C3
MGSSAAAKVFELDAVLGPESEQAAVWAEVQPLVTSAMDGYQACILAFGQTGRYVGGEEGREGRKEGGGEGLRKVRQLS